MVSASMLEPEPMSHFAATPNFALSYNEPSLFYGNLKEQHDRSSPRKVRQTLLDPYSGADTSRVQVRHTGRLLGDVR